MKRTTKYILTIILLAIPFALIAYHYHMPDPYRLSGKHFLVFYISQILAVCISLAVLLHKKQPADQQYLKADTGSRQHPQLNTAAKSICILSLLMGLIRLLQGLSNHKPVGFLILLLCFNLIIYSIMWRTLRKQ